MSDPRQGLCDGARRPRGERRGSAPVKSSTVDGSPESVPASTSAPQPSRIRCGTSSRLAAAGSPGSFALVAATAPTASSTYCAARGKLGDADADRVGALAVQPGVAARRVRQDERVRAREGARARARRSVRGARARTRAACRRSRRSSPSAGRRRGPSARRGGGPAPRGRPTRRGRRRRRRAAAPAGRRESQRPPRLPLRPPSSLDHPLPSGEIPRDRSPLVAELPRAARGPRPRGPRGVSSTIAPPGRSTSRAAPAIRSVCSSPTSATRGSQSRTSGCSASTSASRTYGGFETTRSNGPVEPVEEARLDELDARARAARRSRARARARRARRRSR